MAQGSRRPPFAVSDQSKSHAIHHEHKKESKCIRIMTRLWIWDYKPPDQSNQHQCNRCGRASALRTSTYSALDNRSCSCTTATDHESP
jgi:hypothetical protein